MPQPEKTMNGFSRRNFLSLTTALLLSGCGWRLRGRQTVPLKTVYIALGENSAIQATIRRNLEAMTNLKIVPTPEEAEATLEWFGTQRSTSVLAVNSKGRARIYSLRLSVNYRVKLQNGVELIPATRISATRELSWDEDDYNGRVAEEQLLFQDMEQNLVHRVVTRLAHISPELVESRARDIE